MTREAPEKIYINSNLEDRTWLIGKGDTSFIEYTRTDAFDVDLDKEIDNVWNPHFNLGWDDNSLVSINHKSFESIAKHFFELGLKAQK